ncbi:nuclear transport factor 2 family protein [Burkholderia pyrrocinia]|uniref:nuclear transport factor 2 family protein n=1 Tax=Burkholderia pyrrocinia TaxID=60550 RepID=UPI001FC8462C|nr:nuclear transport factor 2 family protein [Burkholderia pyrrocinia]
MGKRKGVESAARRPERAACRISLPGRSGPSACRAPSPSSSIDGRGPTTQSAVDIANLLYRYAERLDAGDLLGVAELFRHARIKTKEGAPTIGADELLALFGASVKRYPCCTPRTKHVVTNPIIEIDEAAHRATARSYYTVLQAVDGLAPQPVAAGRHHDAFERVDGMWRFTCRDYTLFDFAGDLRYHLNPNDPPVG